MKSKIRGIIFDMDNTLLRSRIDFKAMKNETFDFLSSKEILPKDLDLKNHTISTIIQEAIRTNLMTNELLQEMWEISKKYETIGMQGADLEPGVKEVLFEIKSKYRLAIVTNNSVEAAKTALKDNHILDFFDCVVGREMVNSLKPSPDGYFYILNQYKEVPSHEWISVGDAWVDGKASTTAGIKFISYQGDTTKMNMMGVYPLAEINKIREVLHYL